MSAQYPAGRTALVTKSRAVLQQRAAAGTARACGIPALFFRTGRLAPIKRAAGRATIYFPERIGCGADLSPTMSANHVVSPENGLTGNGCRMPAALSRTSHHDSRRGIWDGRCLLPGGFSLGHAVGYRVYPPLTVLRLFFHCKSLYLGLHSISMFFSYTLKPGLTSLTNVQSS